MEVSNSKYGDVKAAVRKVLGRGDLQTAEKIRDVIGEYRKFPPFEIDDSQAEKLAREMENSLGVSMEIGSVITEQDHEEWLTAAKTNINPFFWERYRQLLEQKIFPPGVIAKLDETTDRILGLLGNPNEVDHWDRRGMVVGHVQSGKTANYTALVCKAADAGYRLIVIIAGMHNNLRNQTQERIDEGFVGRDSARLVTKKKDKYIGVGRIDNTHIPVSITSSLRDFNKHEAESNPFDLEVLKVPLVLVIKKNTRTLNNVIMWLKEHNAKGKNQLIEAPMLIIDDEADNASIDISKSPDESSRINSQIRELLNQFRRSCYIGYTATPFANIFIDPDNEHAMLGEDLFPRDFIVSLEAPDNYFGAEKIFDENASTTQEIIDNEDVLPVKHKNNHEVGELPESLKKAVRTFILCRAIRLLRGDESSHNSMLVNASRFVSVQGELRNAIHSFLENIKKHVRFNSAKSERQALRDDQIESLHEVWRKEYSDLEFSWSQIQSKLNETAAPIKVVEVNSKSSGQLNYSDHEEAGLNVIAVGGFSLSRGLTLEGLSISYFLRNSMMYDTLLQMGRWFGYRPGYADLCRVWLSPDAEGWYEHISESIEELRDEIRKMEKLGLTPKDFGLKVRSHPDALIVTARNKMGSSENVKVKVGLGNRFIETSTLWKRKEIIQANRNVAADLLRKLGVNSYVKPMPRLNYLWHNAGAQDVMDFIGAFQNHPNSFYTESDPVIEYIRKRMDDELENWDVVVISTRDGTQDDSLGISVKRQRRTEKKNTVNRNDYLVVTEKQRIADARMEAIGLDEKLVEVIGKDWAKDKKGQYLREGKTIPSDRKFSVPGRMYREVRTHPLLILHLLTIQKPADAEGRNELSINEGVVGWSISFPETECAEETVEYTVNTTWWKETYGGDFDDEGAEDE